MATALITGGTRGLGRALVQHLTHEGWTVLFDARRDADVARALAEVERAGHAGEAIGIPGDVADPRHHTELVVALGNRGLDLLVNNAGSLGPSPLPHLIELEQADLVDLFTTNAVAPLSLFRAVRTRLEDVHGVVVNISSDAAVEAYDGWGGYGASKAALDHISKVLANEHPELAVYAFDPGDMRTDMHQAAFPGADISDRASPESVVPSLMKLIERRPPSGRYSVDQLSNSPILR